MRYEAIHGWFGWETLYHQLLTSAPPNARFIEVGVWLGKSISYLAELRNSVRPDIEIHAVDHWFGCERCQEEIVQALEGDEDEVYRMYLRNTEGLNIINHRGNSTVIAASFPDRYFHNIFIDADHKFSSVVADIKAWLPKTNCFIGGHDIVSWPSVKKAVEVSFPDYERHGDCWLRRI